MEQVVSFNLALSRQMLDEQIALLELKLANKGEDSYLAEGLRERLLVARYDLQALPGKAANEQQRLKIQALEVDDRSSAIEHRRQWLEMAERHNERFLTLLERNTEALLAVAKAIEGR